MANQDNAAENAVATTGEAQAPANAETTSETTTSDVTASDVNASDATASEETASEETAAPVADNTTEESSVAQNAASEEAPTRAEQVNTPQPELNDALSPLGNQPDAPRKEVANGRSYEIIFIARVGDDEAVEAATQRLRELVEGGEGAIDNVRTSEVRRLAYPIQKEMEGIYVVVNGRFAKELTSEIDRFFKLEEVVLRHMLLRDDA
ncbi:MAG: small subunit ribosomal protein [Abditibacteriota bacterium]|nr:small subunit ribosomal protein [Abditibacteriota bacterium]